MFRITAPPEIDRARVTGAPRRPMLMERRASSGGSFGNRRIDLRSLHVSLAVLAGIAALVGVVPACARGGAGGFDSTEEGDTPVFGSGSCIGASCPDGACVTKLVGTVVAPNGLDPVYNAVVFVPTAPLEAIHHGATCERCDKVSGAPISAAVSAPDGRFEIEVPAGDKVPLVVQLGKLLRQVQLPPITPCTTTELDPNFSRLPRSQREGDVPLHAVSTGNCDRLECILRKIGLDDSEFTTPTGGGRVHLYKENGATLPGISPADSLTTESATLKGYDLVLFDCAGEAIPKTTSQKQNVVDYAYAGGRVFASHFSYVWLDDVPPFSSTASWDTSADIPSFQSMPAKLDTSFARGDAFARWMARVGAIATEGDRMIDILDPRFDVTDIMAPAQRWIYTDDPPSIQEFTFNTPLEKPVEDQCGRVAFSDFHVTGTSCTPDGFAFPRECENAASSMSPQERVLEFMLFDLASCIQDYGPPKQPIK
jgi:hypothetical protein